MRHAQRPDRDNTPRSEDDLSARAAHCAAALLCLVSFAEPVHGQRISVWLDASASTTRPPAGIEADNAAYGLLGLRIESRFARTLRLNARAHAGAGARAQDGRWLFGEATAGYDHAVGPIQALGDVGVFGLRYDEPYRYDAQAIRLRPGIAGMLGSLRLSLRADVLRGDWSSVHTAAAEPIPLPGDGTEIHREGTLRIDGVEGMVGGYAGELDLELGLGVRDATNGTVDGRYTTGHLLASLPAGPVDLFGVARLQDAAGEIEFGVEVGAAAMLGGRVQVVGLLTRAVTDPVYGTRPGFGISAGASVRLGGGNAGESGGVVSVGAPDDGRRAVTVRLERPGMSRVEIAGSFNGWQLIPMQRTDGVWMLTLRLEPGTYIFAFHMPDGTWFVPDDAPGIVDDGFGRRNSTLVVPPL